MPPSSKEQVPADKFKKPGPWVIGFSWPGVGNTWIIQNIQEVKYAGSHDPNIKELRFVEANWQPAKQVADIEDLMAHKVDALIVAPIAVDLVKAQVDAAAKAGIPVIVFSPSGVFTGATVSVYAGGEAFGRTGGEFLKDRLHSKGTIWAFRGIAGVGEDNARYNGLLEAIKGTDIKIGAEVYGDWNYAKGKQLCENLVASGQPVDGIWFSGADMTRACFDVFKEIGKPLVPMTGEANNGFLRAWKSAGADSVGPIFTPGLATSMVRAATALLEGKPLYTAYYSDPKPITSANFDQYYRPDLNDAFWFPSTLPEDVIDKTFKK
jgi:ribose transport system substrate-binding protein